MATPQIWTLDDRHARTRWGDFEGVVTLLEPGAGVQLEVPAGCRLLGVALPDAPLTSSRLLESYVRGPDLVAAYQASAAWPVRLDTCWRAYTGDTAGAALVVDLVVSAHTELLASQPRLPVVSEVPAVEAWRLVEQAPVRFEPLTLGTERHSTFLPPEASGCYLLRLPGSAWSCAVMAHGEDFVQVEASSTATVTRVGFDVFAPSLEKGVILRARLRAAIVPRPDDLARAAVLYDALLRAELPLGT